MNQYLTASAKVSSLFLIRRSENALEILLSEVQTACCGWCNESNILKNSNGSNVLFTESIVRIFLWGLQKRDYVYC